MRIEVGILKSRIFTDNPKLLSTLRDLYSFKIPGCEFTSAYIHHRWDGKKYFINENGVFRTGLLGKILETLEKIECKPDLIYLNKPVDINYDISSTYELREYQQSIVDDALLQERGIIKAPTGSGKTYIIARILEHLSAYPTVVLCRGIGPLNQLYTFLQENTNLDVGISYGQEYKYGNIMLSTDRSISNILDTHLEEARTLLVDEVHEFSKGKKTIPIIESFPNACYRFGFTATPPKEPIPQLTLEGAFGPEIEQVTTSGLIESEYLSKPNIQIVPLNCITENQEYLGYLGIYDKYIINNKFRNELIVKICEKIFSQNSGNILILVKNLIHGEILYQMLSSRYKYIYKLEGKDSVETREDVKKKFVSAKKSTLIATRILQTGINIPQITHFINARGLKAEIPTIQALGRALRATDVKKTVMIYDFLDDQEYIRQHSKHRIKHYKSQGHTINKLPEINYAYKV